MTGRVVPPFRIWMLALACGAATLLGPAAYADCPPPVPGEDPFIPQEVMVRVLDQADVDAALSRIGQRWPGTIVVDSIPSRRIYLLTVPLGTSECDVADDLLLSLVDPDPNTPDPNRPLAWSELNYEGQGIEGQTGSIYIGYSLPDAEARYFDQYAGQMLGLSTAQTRASGRGVAVAVLDTGVDPTHTQLAGRLLAGFNFVTMTTNTSDVGDGLDNDGDGVVDDLVGHGTFVAGLIALTAPDVRILPVVVLNSDGVGDAFRIARGMFYAIDRGVEVINLSLSSTYKSEAVSDAVEEARNWGIAVVAAAGNENTDTPREYPAMTSNVLGIAATDENDIKAAFSNYHPTLFLSAPGTSAADPIAGQFDPLRSIYSTVPGDGFGVWEGTSFSTALVSGTVALLRAQHPEWPAARNTLDQIEALLAATARPIDALNDPALAGMLGVGRLDTAAAVLSGPPAPTPGDLDNDGDVDLDDLTFVLRDFGTVHSSADLDADGLVELDDLTILLVHFGP